MGQNSGFRAEWILVLVTVLAAFGWIFSKEALAGLPPLFFMGTRFLIAGFVLFLVGKKHFRVMQRVDVKQAIMIGAVMGIAMMSWITGLDKGTNLGVGAFITCLGVVFVPIIGRLVFGVRSTLSIWVALPVAVVGLAFLALSNGLSFEVAHLYFLGTAIGIALQLNLLSRFLVRMHVLVLTSIQLSTAGVLLLCISLLAESLPQSVELEVVGWFFASTLIATSLRYLLQTYGLSLTPVSHGAVIMNLEPVWAAIFAVLWFDEVMTIGQVFGCFLIFFAMLVSRWSQIKGIFKSH
ncbi:DMT family transporter [Marinomonas sp. 5E14-1]|uniref:DMT family transporter n=1 Tax=Marinomonas sp. 5E14-1 TaxID=3153922 RepID=UPI00326446F4